MYSQNSHPRWWQVYLTLPLLVGLLVIDSRFNISARGHQVVQMGIVVLIYGLIHFWLKANSAALSEMDRKQYYGGFGVLRVPPSRLHQSNGRDLPILRFPASEIQGVLSDTFEMDCIDAKFQQVKQVSQESKKE